jgi:alpha-N-arabinofuranosidase
MKADKQCIRWWVFLLSAAGLMLCAAPPALSQTQANLVHNYSFEQPLPGGWSGIWEIRQELYDRGRLLLTPKYRKTGLFSLSLIPNSHNIVDSSFYDYGLIQRLPADKYRGKSLHYEAWMNAEGGAVAQLRMVAVDADGNVVLRVLRKESEPNPNRQLVLLQDIFDVPTQPLKELFVFCSVEGVTGSAYFDDVLVEESSGGQFDAQKLTGPLTATILVNSQKIIRKIPQSLYGMNIEYAHGFYGVFNQYTNSYSPDMLSLVRDLGVNNLRFPGGLFSNFYHWWDGVGPIDSRPSDILLPNREESINTFGTDEALEFARRTDSSLYFTVNAYSGTPEEAGDWVRYVGQKGATGGTWEVGNEIYFVNNPNDPAGPFWTPERYVDTFQNFARAIRDADSTAKIAADIEFNFGMRGCGQISADGCWADVVLKGAGDQIDYVALHNALAPIMIGEDAGWPVRTVYEGMLAAPLQVKDLLDALSDKVDKLTGPNASRIRFAMVEYGPFFQTDPQSRFIDHVKTLASALYTASLLKVLIEHPRVDVAQGFSLFDPWTQGWIGFRDDAYTAKAPYYALQLFTRYFGDLLIDTQTTGPTYSARSIGLVPATMSAPYLDVVSSLHARSGDLRIIAINKNLDQPIQANFFVNGFVAEGSVQAWTLNGIQPDSNTGTTTYSTVPPGTYADQTVYQPNGRFNLGGPGEITLTSSPVLATGRCIYVELPAHSMTALLISGYSTPTPNPSGGCEPGTGE